MILKNVVEKRNMVIGQWLTLKMTEKIGFKGEQEIIPFFFRKITLNQQSFWWFHFF